MSNQEFYMFSRDSVAIKKSYENISLMLIGELTRFCDPVIMLSLLEDIKQSLIAHYYGDSKNQYIIDTEIEGLHINAPKTLRSRLATRASDEKCSIDTLCVDYLSRGLSGTLK